MSCSHPLLAVYKGKDEAGKKIVKVVTRLDSVNSVEEAVEKYQLFGHEVMLLPCGHCPGCMKARRKQWAIRCEHEAKYYVDNCFITLTYDDEHYFPKDKEGNRHVISSKDCKMDYQMFIQVLRNKGIKLRYFGCCERGSKSNRLHLHLICFGYIPSDLKASHKSDSGFWCYTSKFLSDIWKKGLVVVSEFTPECAAYVAGYVDKKLFSSNDDSFIFMSTRPGIGRRYIEENLGKLYDYDNVVISFGSHKAGLPRYFDKVAEQNGLVLDDIKAKRIASSKVQVKQKFREFNVVNYCGYFDRILQNEIEAMRSRKRGL